MALSGSAKLLLMKNVSDFVGRAVYFDLMLFSYSELIERRYGSWSELFF